MKAELKILVIFFLLFVYISSPISSSSQINGYDIVHTRVMEGSFKTISFEDAENQYYNQGVKLNYTIELWNPATENVTFTYDSRGSCGFVLTFNDSMVPREITCGIYAINPNISVSPGITTINVAYEKVYSFSHPDETNFTVPNGNYNVELKLHPLQNSSYPFGVSYSSSIEFLNNNSIRFEPHLPDNWGIIDDSLPAKISTAITHAEFRFIQLKNSQIVTVGFIGEAWNPKNEPVYTTSSHDCYDRLRFEKAISYSNDFFLDDTPTICLAIVMQYETDPGVHQWDESTMTATLYNWNSPVLPDSKYYFYFTLFQNSLNIHKSTITVNNGLMEIDYVTSPLWIQQVVDTPSIVNTSSTKSTTTIYPSVTQESEVTIDRLFVFQPLTLFHSIILVSSIRYLIRKKIE